MKEFVEKLRKKGDVFEKCGCSADGIVKDYRKSADMIEKLCEKSNIGEFVEKLIERLEEEKEENPCRNMKCKECQYTRNCYEGEKSSEVAIDNAIKIINQLAEEYNPSKTSSLDKLSKEPKTKIENIRSMSVEELADEILKRGEISTVIDFCQNFGDCCETISEEECRKCLINWLNAPVEQKKAIPTEHFETRFNTVV